jgi:hypothetical protein
MYALHICTHRPLDQAFEIVTKGYQLSLAFLIDRFSQLVAPPSLSSRQRNSANAVVCIWRAGTTAYVRAFELLTYESLGRIPGARTADLFLGTLASKLRFRDHKARKVEKPRENSSS